MIEAKNTIRWISHFLCLPSFSMEKYALEYYQDNFYWIRPWKLRHSEVQCIMLRIWGWKHAAYDWIFDRINFLTIYSMILFLKLSHWSIAFQNVRVFWVQCNRSYFNSTLVHLKFSFKKLFWNEESTLKNWSMAVSKLKLKIDSPNSRRILLHGFNAMPKKTFISKLFNQS